MALTNGVIMQYFHWYYPADGSLWKNLQNNAQSLADAGMTALWLPPAYKGAAGKNDVGYGVYDMYDLGEFDQKGSIPTKYGSRQEYLDSIKAAHAAGLQVYADVAFNHRAGADQTEWVEAIRVHENDRRFTKGDKLRIQAHTRFDFPARNNKYSSFKWRYYHFDGVDRAENLNENSIFKFIGTGKDWDNMVDDEFGNYDYLMHCDLDMDHPEVRAELINWGKWYLDTTGVDGFRLDAVKHIKFGFFRLWLDRMRNYTGKNLFAVGEYWEPYDVKALQNYISHTQGTMSLFDAPLHRNFHDASQAGGDYDMRCILDNTLVQHQPDLAVTLVDNHDTQPLQSLESPVQDWFKPLAYTIILLREQGYPCVFYPAYYGAEYTGKGSDGQDHHITLAPVQKLHELLIARRDVAYGPQHDYFDDPNIIGWTREGIDEKPGSGLAAILSDGSGGSKWMNVGQQHAGKTFHDTLGHRTETVTVNQDGWAEFYVNGGSVSVWTPA